MLRITSSLLMVVLLGVSVSVTVLAQSAAEFRLGFKALADQIPDVVGVPLEQEHYGANGDSLQQTNKGLMVWRKADNATVFTNGARTWANGPYGVMERANDERFEWEAPDAPAATVVPTAALQPLALTAVPVQAPKVVARNEDAPMAIAQYYLKPHKQYWVRVTSPSGAVPFDYHGSRGESGVYATPWQSEINFPDSERDFYRRLTVTSGYLCTVGAARQDFRSTMVVEIIEGDLGTTAGSPSAGQPAPMPTLPPPPVPTPKPTLVTVPTGPLPLSEDMVRSAVQSIPLPGGKPMYSTTVTPRIDAASIIPIYVTMHLSGDDEDVWDSKSTPAAREAYVSALLDRLGSAYPSLRDIYVSFYETWDTNFIPSGTPLDRVSVNSDLTFHSIYNDVTARLRKDGVKQYKGNGDKDWYDHITW